jgi:hypothetical protein
LTRQEPETDIEVDTPEAELEPNRRKRFVAWAVRWHTPLLVIGALVSLAPTARAYPSTSSRLSLSTVPMSMSVTASSTSSSRRA